MDSAANDIALTEFGHLFYRLKDYPDRELIMELTKFCEIRIDLAAHLADIIIARIIDPQTNMTYKKPIFYLIDSVMKNVGGPYAALFSRHIAEVFERAYGEIPDKDKTSLEFLLNTWEERKFLSAELINRIRENIALRGGIGMSQHHPIQNAQFPAHEILNAKAPVVSVPAGYAFAIAPTFSGVSQQSQFGGPEFARDMGSFEINQQERLQPPPRGRQDFAGPEIVDADFERFKRPRSLGADLMMDGPSGFDGPIGQHHLQMGSMGMESMGRGRPMRESGPPQNRFRDGGGGRGVDFRGPHNMNGGGGGGPGLRGGPLSYDEMLDQEIRKVLEQMYDEQVPPPPQRIPLEKLAVANPRLVSQLKESAQANLATLGFPAPAGPPRFARGGRGRGFGFGGGGGGGGGGGDERYGTPSGNNNSNNWQGGPGGPNGPGVPGSRGVDIEWEREADRGRVDRGRDIDMDRDVGDGGRATRGRRRGTRGSGKGRVMDEVQFSTYGPGGPGSGSGSGLGSNAHIGGGYGGGGRSMGGRGRSDREFRRASPDRREPPWRSQGFGHRGEVPPMNPGSPRIFMGGPADPDSQFPVIPMPALGMVGPPAPVPGLPGDLCTAFVCEEMVLVNIPHTLALLKRIQEVAAGRTLPRPGLLGSIAGDKSEVADKESDAALRVASQRTADRLKGLLDALNVPPQLPPMLYCPLPLEPSKDFEAKMEAERARLRKPQVKQESPKIEMPSFKVEDLDRHPGVALKPLYEDRPHWYPEDGLRFKTARELTCHIDTYLERKMQLRKKEASGERDKREYYCTTRQWVTNFGAASAIVIDSKKGRESDGSSDDESGTYILPADENFTRCPVSREVFETFWDDEEGEMMYRNAVRVLVTEAADKDIFALGLPCSDPTIRYLIVHKLLVMDDWLNAGKADTLMRAKLRYDQSMATDKGKQLGEALTICAGEDEDENDVFVLLELR